MNNFHFRHKIISVFQDIDIRGFRKIAHFLPKMLIPKPKGKQTIKTLYKFQMQIDPVKDNGVEDSLYYTGTYEKGTLFIMKNILNEGDTFIDIGANIGLMSIYASSLLNDTGKVIAFEPNPITRKILEENIELNNIKNIEVSSYAIAANKGSAKIYDRWDSNRGSSSLIKPEIETDSYNVDVINLSDYIPEKTSVDLIKIDVEGFELEVLNGSLKILQRKTPPMLIVECSEERENTFGIDTSTIYNTIKNSNNYRLFKSTGGKERVSKLIEIKDKTELPSHDNIYCFTNEHIDNVPKKIFKINH